jgi:hypothetical protein
MTAKAKAARISKARAKQKAKTTKSIPRQSWAERARASAVVFWLEVGAICATLLGLGFAGWGLWEQVHVNRDDALARNWTLLTTPASGNSGKVQALEYLASKGMVLDGIDLSCNAMRGIEKSDAGEDRCARPPYLQSLNLSETKHGQPISLIRANLSGANLVNANLSGAYLGGADLSGAGLVRANLSGAYLWGSDLSGAELIGANLSGASLGKADLSGAKLSEANLSGANLSSADFRNAKGIDRAEFTDAWAWAIRKPTDLPVKIDLCLPEQVPEQVLVQELLLLILQRPNPCIAPEG